MEAVEAANPATNWMTIPDEADMEMKSHDVTTTSTAPVDYDDLHYDANSNDNDSHNNIHGHDDCGNPDNVDADVINEGVIVDATVDGTLAEISRSTRLLLWKQHNQRKQNHETAATRVGRMKPPSRVPSSSSSSSGRNEFYDHEEESEAPP